MSNDRPLASAVAAGLGTKSYDDVEVVSDPDEALGLIDGRQYAAAILDYDRAEPAGRRFLERYREVDPLLPVVVITRQPSYEDAVEFLRGGSSALALDYIEIIRMPEMELLGRIQAVIDESLSIMTVGDFVIDRRMRRVYCRDEEIHLTPTETRLFMAFMTRPNRELTYEDLYLALVGHRADSHEQAITKLKAHLNRVRDKIGTAARREVIRRPPDRVWYSSLSLTPNDSGPKD